MLQPAQIAQQRIIGNDPFILYGYQFPEPRQIVDVGIGAAADGKRSGYDGAIGIGGTELIDLCLHGQGYVAVGALGKGQAKEAQDR